MNIERIESGAAHLDRTSDQFYVDPAVAAAQFDDAAKRHFAAFSADDLVDAITEMQIVDVARLLAAIKAGDATAAGSLLAEVVAARITDLAAYSVQ